LQFDRATAPRSATHCLHSLLTELHKSLVMTMPNIPYREAYVLAGRQPGNSQQYFLSTSWLGFGWQRAGIRKKTKPRLSLSGRMARVLHH
jgi:hypothetical protein